MFVSQFIFCLSRRVPLLYLQTVIEGVVRTLKVMYGSLDRYACVYVISQECYVCRWWLYKLCLSLQLLLWGGERSSSGSFLLPLLSAAHPAVAFDWQLQTAHPRHLRESVLRRAAGRPLAHFTSRHKGAITKWCMSSECNQMPHSVSCVRLK